MQIYIIKRDKVYLFAGIVTCLCAAFILLHFYSCSKMSVGAFLVYSSDIDRRETEQVEIFDIEKGSVTGSYNNNAVFRKEACKYLGSITGMNGNVKVFPKLGYIVKLPLEPPVKASSKYLKAAGINFVDKIYVIFSSHGRPYLLILDGQSKPYCFNFEADLSTLKVIFQR
ncbi:MAG TPA: hypothetical protein VHT96_09335 [Clostridia bacterium]|nr:hypothetical protein [Clostridia bacterium]